MIFLHNVEINKLVKILNSREFKKTISREGENLGSKKHETQRNRDVEKQSKKQDIKIFEFEKRSYDHFVTLMLNVQMQIQTVLRFPSFFRTFSSSEKIN